LAELPHVGLYRRATAAALVLAPALFLADNLIHPKELERGNEARQLAETADAYTRWQLAHALGFCAIVVFAAAVLGLAFLVRRRQPGLGLAGGALAVAGLIGLGAAITIDGFTWGVLGEVSTKGPAAHAGAVVALHDVQHSDWSFLYYLTPLGFIVGMVLLAVGTVRQGAVPAWSGGLLVVAVLMTGTETAIVSNAYFIAGASVLLAGGVATAWALWRMSDAEFASGGPRQ
jgi:hypothetical protein